MEFPRQLDVTPWHDIILRYWSCPLWQSGAYYLASLTWVLTRSDWPFPWSKTHCSYYSWIHNTSLWCLYRSSARSDFGFSIPNYGIHTRWNSVGILRPLLWFKNLGIRRSPSWAPAYHWWIWAYAARHEGWMGDGSGWWAAVLAPSREQGRTVCATAQSTDWGVIYLNDPGLFSLKARLKVDRVHRQRVVERIRAKGKEDRKSAGVRKQGASCPYPMYLKVFKCMNRRVKRVCCSTQVFALSVSQYMFPLQRVDGYHYFLYLRLPGLCWSNYNE